MESDKPTGRIMPPGRNRVEFLSIVGSLASLAALGVVLVDKVAAVRDPLLVALQAAHSVLCMIGIGATCLIALDYVRRTAVDPSISLAAKTLRVSAIFSLAVLFLWIFLSGLIAAIYWRWWFSPIAQFL